jgi:hypothetical protein
MSACLRGARSICEDVRAAAAGDEVLPELLGDSSVPRARSATRGSARSQATQSADDRDGAEHQTTMAAAAPRRSIQVNTGHRSAVTRIATSRTTRLQLDDEPDEDPRHRDHDEPPRVGGRHPQARSRLADLTTHRLGADRVDQWGAASRPSKLDPRGSGDGGASGDLEELPLVEAEVAREHVVREHLDLRVQLGAVVEATGRLDLVLVSTDCCS